jgi:hypothetical protein
MKKYIAALLLTVASYGAAIYDNAAAWNSDTNHHAMTQLNNGDTGPFILTGNGYTFGSHNVNIGFFSNTDALTIQMANGDRIQGILLGGTNLSLGSEICAEADGLHIGCWPQGTTWTGTWGAVLDNPASYVKLYSTSSVTWSLGFIKASTVPGTSEVPEPATLGLVGLGLAGIGALRRKK